jgi:glutamine amidotransferase
MGNICSIESCLKYLNFDFIVSKNYREISLSKNIILPGVGNFKEAMKNLKAKNFHILLRKLAKNIDVKIMGICLGMQLLCKSSNENGVNKGLGLIPLKVRNFSIKSKSIIKIPHVGFNNVELNENENSFFYNLNGQNDFYFNHSYRAVNKNIKLKKYISECIYGDKFVAIYKRDNICGVQFHPEKSQFNGLSLVKNFFN